MAGSSLVLCFFLLVGLSQAREYIVGGKPDAWKVPSSQSDSLNQWAQNSRFLVGDSLVWKLETEKDSVLQVTKRDYVTCNTSSPVADYKNGEEARVELDRSGPFYFISGAEDHCQKGQKLIVVVMSHRHRGVSAFSPAPSPAEIEGPAVAPTSSAAGLGGGLMVALGIFSLRFLLV